MEAPVTFAFKHTPESVAELDRLGDRIAELSAHLEVATGRLLILIREFDARQGWNTGFRSCAEWLAWRTNLEHGAARERVRVARALGTLPVLSEALGRGDLSYAKVRALTRVARRPRAASWRAGGARGPGGADRTELAPARPPRRASGGGQGARIARAACLPAAGVRCELCGDVSRRSRTDSGRGGPHANDSTRAETGAVASRPYVSLSRMPRPGGRGPPHTPLGAGRADHAVQPRAALPSASPRGARAGLRHPASRRRNASRPPPGRATNSARAVASRGAGRSGGGAAVRSRGGRGARPHPHRAIGLARRAPRRGLGHGRAPAAAGQRVAAPYSPIARASVSRCSAASPMS